MIDLDFCLRSYEEACLEIGLPSRKDSWFGYADDIADRSAGEEEASAALQQLEAASAFVGLRLNIKKCESMGHRITKEVSVASFVAPKIKELVEVHFDNGWFRGWKTEARWASLIGIKSASKEPKTDIAILFEDGDSMFGIAKGGGWMRDEDGDAYGIRKLGMQTAIDEKENKAHRCEGCGSDCDAGLITKTRGWCRKSEHMDSKQLRRLHRTRQSSA